MTDVCSSPPAGAIRGFDDADQARAPVVRSALFEGLMAAISREPVQGSDFPSTDRQPDVADRRGKDPGRRVPIVDDATDEATGTPARCRDASGDGRDRQLISASYAAPWASAAPGTGPSGSHGGVVRTLTDSHLAMLVRVVQETSRAGKARTIVRISFPGGEEAVIRMTLRGKTVEMDVSSTSSRVRGAMALAVEDLRDHLSRGGLALGRIDFSDGDGKAGRAEPEGGPEGAPPEPAPEIEVDDRGNWVMHVIA
jgi:hypothetical protein